MWSEVKCGFWMTLFGIFIALYTIYKFVLWIVTMITVGLYNVFKS